MFRARVQLRPCPWALSNARIVASLGFLAADRDISFDGAVRGYEENGQGSAETRSQKAPHALQDTPPQEVGARRALGEPGPSRCPSVARLISKCNQSRAIPRAKPAIDSVDRCGAPAHSLEPVVAMPRMNARCVKKNKMTIGSVNSTAAAISRFV